MGIGDWGLGIGDWEKFWCCETIKLFLIFDLERGGINFYKSEFELNPKASA
ncbi:MAG: hypothetical protein V7L11_24175 [Nostoc sp.]|uniref:hypothetical protein n=1 Tax=Nostoc sp. TaxID=1180 RepID=UPI002FF8A51B